ncbi:MAG: DUF5615 family PIN-like protein [Methanosarcinales archaeon]
MSKIRIYTNENIYGTVARVLRGWGYDAISAPESRRLTVPDEEQMEFAVNQRRTILTFDIKDYTRLHTEYISSGLHHYGIIISKRLKIKELLQRLQKLLQTLTAEDMYDRLEYLGQWK